MSQSSFIDRNGPIFKIVFCAFLGLMLMIPASMIEDLVSDRETRKSEAVTEVASKWGSDLVVTGPILSIPYTTPGATVANPNGGLVVQGPKSHFLHILPSTLELDTKLDPSVRTRGIYEVIVYKLDTKLAGKYDLSGIVDMMASRNGTPDMKNAVLSMGLSDPKGIESIGKIKFADKEYSFTPGVAIRSVIPTGVSTKLDLSNVLSDSSNRPKEMAFESSFSIRGAESVKYIPLGKETNVTVASPWKSPSFDGAFLPVDREVSDKGFSAKWKILDFNRDFPEAWDDDAYSLQYIPTTTTYAGSRNNWNEYGNMSEVNQKMMDTSTVSSMPSANLGTMAFGVSLYTPVDNYDKTARTIKYAILVIGLTFVAFFLMEVSHKRRIHPIQYLLVGFALCVFYTILLSLSEHISFNTAYLVSALLTAGLITSYVALAFRVRSLALTIGGILAFLYGFIFVILQSEDYALLLGSFGIFLTLAVLMYVTRNIDWYKIGNREE